VRQRAAQGRPETALFPFHCWRISRSPVFNSWFMRERAEQAALCLVPFRDGTPVSLLADTSCSRLSVRFMRKRWEQAALRLVAAWSASSRFTVGQLFMLHIYQLYSERVPPWGYTRGVEPSRFTVGQRFVRLKISTLCEN